jgi:spermidine/putrescine transport system permease protein
MSAPDWPSLARDPATTQQLAGTRQRARHRPSLLAAVYFSMIALLYLPLAILFLFSINANTSLSFPLQGLTLSWYSKLFASDAVLRAARNSLAVASGSSVVATVLGTMVALLALRYQFRGKRLLIMLAILPLIVPFIVLGVALLLLFSALHIDRSLWTIGIAHTVVALPYTLLIVVARLAGFDPALEEAAMDLGADYPTALRRIVLPIVAPAMVSAWLVAFTVSFDEFALALFLAGTEPTFPVYLFSQLRFANRLPVMIAMAVLLMLGTLVLVLIAERVRRVES